ncbi:MAG: methyltransferase family protein [Nitrospiraceae bacterium]
MNDAVLLLILVNFLFIGILPVIFFKRGGSLNLMWWLTAAPYFICVILLTASFLRIYPPVTEYDGGFIRILGLIAVVVSTASIFLIAYTLGTHRRPIALWHQTNDATEELVTYGAYGRIRHPFYAAFLLALLAALIFSPQLGTLATFVYGLLIMNYTAAKEERRMRGSQFGAEYEAYIGRTGRFVPRLRRRTR